MAKARAAMRVFMVGLHIWTIVLALHRRLRPIGRRLRAGPWQRARRRGVTAITDSGRFRTIQIRLGGAGGSGPRRACPGCGAARNEVERCTADPGPPRTGTVPGLQRIVALRFTLRCARDTRNERNTGL